VEVVYLRRRIDMQRYIGVKIVSAESAIKDGKDGYKVIYEDGYVSWCPKAVFEKHNQMIDGMPFGHALEACKAGARIARRGWNGKGQYVFLIPDYVFTRGYADEIPALKDETREITFWGCLCIMTTSGKVQLGWLATQSDMQAADWEVV
jgi:hypothetical protein